MRRSIATWWWWSKEGIVDSTYGYRPSNTAMKQPERHQFPSNPDLAQILELEMVARSNGMSKPGATTLP
ncbi:hypothetical protein ACM7TW_31225, partial [Pseudomonas aeruginosa]